MVVVITSYLLEKVFYFFMFSYIDLNVLTTIFGGNFLTSFFVSPTEYNLNESV